MTNPGPAARPALSPLGTILLGGLAIGTIDILWAIIMTALDGRGPVSVLQSVAGGLLGKATYDGGAGTALLGITVHYFIATCVMTTYYLASRQLPQLARRPWLYGILYGIVVYVVMYQVVLPLSAWHTKGIKMGTGLAKGLFIHMFGIGLVAGLVTRRGTAKD
ncbi:MAG: hypothetical protein ABI836_02465 [Gemmatimonadota bacterium]